MVKNMRLVLFFVGALTLTFVPQEGSALSLKPVYDDLKKCVDVEVTQAHKQSKEQEVNPVCVHFLQEVTDYFHGVKLDKNAVAAFPVPGVMRCMQTALKKMKVEPNTVFELIHYGDCSHDDMLMFNPQLRD